MPTRNGSSNSLQSEAGDNIRSYAARKEAEARALLAEAEGLKVSASQRDKDDDAKESKRVADLGRALTKAPKPDEVKAMIDRVLDDGANKLILGKTDWQVKRFNGVAYLSDEEGRTAKAASKAGLAVLKLYFPSAEYSNDSDKFKLFSNGGFYSDNPAKPTYGAFGKLIEKIKEAPEEIKNAARAYLAGELVKFSESHAVKQSQIPHGGFKRGDRDGYSLQTQRDYHSDKRSIVQSFLKDIG